MARYRATRQSSYNNWQYRIEILPYDATLSDTVETLPEGTIVEIGDLEYGFDDVLPYGLANPATWSVKLNFSRLPSALQSKLEQKSQQYTNILFGSYDAQNTFLYFTDSGTNGATWTLLFCGVVEDAEGTDYDVNDSGELETTYNLVDGAYFAMLEIPGSMAGFQPSATKQTGGLIYDYYAITGRSQWRNEFGSKGATNIATAYFKTWDDFAGDIAYRVSGWTWLTVTRFTNATHATTNFDNGSRLADLIDTGARFKSYNTDGSGNAFADLSGSSAYILQYIESNGERIGGMYSPNDEYGISQAQCVKDQLSDLCETFCVKLYWSPEYVTDAGGDYIRWNVEVATLLGNGRDNSAATSYYLSKAVGINTLSTGAGIIGRSEVRTALEGEDKNVSEIVTSSARSRTERSINIEPILHNVPTPKRDITQRFLSGITYQQRESIGVDQTNCIFSNDGAFAWGGLSYGFAKAHHDTKVVVRGGANGGVITTYYEATSNAKPVSAEEPEHIAWMNTVQAQACLPKALTKALYETFSNPLQCSVSVVWRVATNTMPNQLGYVHALEDSIAADLTQYNWLNACVTKCVHSFANGTNEITYFLPGV